MIRSVLAVGLLSSWSVLLVAALAGSVEVYRASFDRGPDRWTTGKNKLTPEGEQTWHRNILGFWGHGVPLEWSPQGGRSGGFAYSESPWYFDDNHGEFGWLHLIATRVVSEQAVDRVVAGQDLRNATVRFSLRGRDLQPKGTRLYFWVQGPAPPVRLTSPADRRPPPTQNPYQKEVYRCWAYTAVPLEGYLLDGQWHDVTLKLDPDESKWSYLGLINGGLARKIRVTQSLTFGDGTLPYVLGNGRLYCWGFMLVEVDPLDQPTGKIDLDEFSVTLASSNPPLPDPRDTR